jgi:hypothetical protein
MVSKEEIRSTAVFYDEQQLKAPQSTWEAIMVLFPKNTTLSDLGE